MAALSLAAVGGTGRESGLGTVVSDFAAIHSPFPAEVRRNHQAARHGTYVALAADHLVAVELGGQGLERGLNNTTSQTEHQVQSGFLFDKSRKRIKSAFMNPQSRLGRCLFLS